MYQLMVTSPQAEALLQADDYYLFSRTIFDAKVPRGYFSAADRAAYRQAWRQPGAITGGVNYYRAARFVEYFPEDERQRFLDQWAQPEMYAVGQQLYANKRTREVFGAPPAVPADDRLDDVSTTPFVCQPALSSVSTKSLGCSIKETGLRTACRTVGCSMCPTRVIA